MLNVKEWIVTKITHDATLSALLAGPNGLINVFPMDIDIQPEQFPCITYADISMTVLSVPRGMHIGTIQLDIYSKQNAKEAEDIYTRLGEIFNFKDSFTETFNGTLWWFREERVTDLHQPNRRLWHKSIDFKVWANNTNNL
jgi:hypothetical protein